MKIKIHITKDILTRSATCGWNGESDTVVTNCAFALAIRDIFPNATVTSAHIFPEVADYRKALHGSALAWLVSADMPGGFSITAEMIRYISWFDRALPGERMLSPERTFELEIPDWAVEQLNQQHVDLAQTILNSPTLELA